jgi:hypothetical protein
MDNGWIKIHRKILEHWIFSDPYYFRAWVIMLMTVNFEDKKVLINGQVIECNRGQSILSIETWVDMFGVSKKKGKWTYQKVRTFFNLLEGDGMIVKENIIKTTRITISNYDSYQNIQQPSNKMPTTKQQPSNKMPTTTKEREELKELKKEKNIDIPALSDFIDYALLNDKLINVEAVKLKYKAWVENDWKDGNNKDIKNWKSKILNTMAYMPKNGTQQRNTTQSAKKDSDF